MLAPLRLAALLMLGLALAVPAPCAAADERALPDMVSLAAREGSAVVTIVTDGTTGTLTARGLGSGLLIGERGEIVTNAHVVADSSEATVRLADGRQFIARIVGRDRSSDIALLAISADHLPSARIGDSTQLRAGQWVVAIGSPFGLAGTVTAGVISAPRRMLPGQALALIQSDVAIHPGSSGGPLFNLQGQAIGINTLAFMADGSHDSGLSFAVPIDIAMDVVRQLRSDGRVARGQLGARVQELTPPLARSFGLLSDAGALVTATVGGSPAERAGLRSGDVIVGLDDQEDAGFPQLQQQIAAARAGQRLRLNVLRRGAMLRVDIVATEAAPDLPTRSPGRPAGNDERLGLNLGEMPAARRDGLGLRSGIPVLEAHGAGSRAGVQADDIIVAVGDRPVRSGAEFDAALGEMPADRPIPLLVQRGKTLGFVAVDRQR